MRWGEPAWTLLHVDGRCDEDFRYERFEFGAQIARPACLSDHERMVIKLYGFCTDRPSMLATFMRELPSALRMKSQKIYIFQGY